MLYHGPMGLTDLEETVWETVKALEPELKRFDSIVVTGLSGVVVGIPVGLLLGKPVVILRKPSDEHHGSYSAINWSQVGERYLFLDDFKAEGTTQKRVLSTIQHWIRQPRYVGSYFYGSLVKYDPPGPDGFRWSRKEKIETANA